MAFPRTINVHLEAYRFLTTLNDGGDHQDVVQHSVSALLSGDCFGFYIYIYFFLNSGLQPLHGIYSIMQPASVEKSSQTVEESASAKAL